MAGLVNNLLDMARLQESGIRLNQQWSMLEEVVGAALAACRRMLDGHAVRTRVPADLPLVKLDVVLIERLFANLLENAAKYSTPGSPITIEGVQSYDGSDKVVTVSVSDEGPGLPVGMEARVFEKFTRGDKESSKPGVGLGLAICRAIVEAHGGKIGAKNRVDALGHVTGACVWFTLPASDAPLLEAPGEESAGAGLDVQAGRTL